MIDVEGLIADAIVAAMNKGEIDSHLGYPLQVQLVVIAAKAVRPLLAEAVAKVELVRTENDLLREAGSPFADFATMYDAHRHCGEFRMPGDTPLVLDVGKQWNGHPTLADCRKIRDLLENNL